MRGRGRSGPAGSPRAVILAYHCIAVPTTDPHRLCVTPRHFAEHLEVLSRRLHAVRLRDLALPPRSRQGARPAVAVTFDDGYGNTLHAARPLLERYGIPATAFIVSGAIGRRQEFWWDEIERLLLQPGLVPPRGGLTVGDARYQWACDGLRRYSLRDFRRHRHWIMRGDEDPTPRHHLYRALYQILQPLSQAVRDGVLRRLRRVLGARSTPRPERRPLSRGELNGLAQGGLIEVGAHTVTHPVLSALSLARQRQEIRRSKVELEAMAGQPVTLFAYPYGSPRHYSPSTVALVRDAGFVAACTTVEGRVGPRSDPWQLPRLIVRDWDGETLADKLEHTLRR